MTGFKRLLPTDRAVALRAFLQLALAGILCATTVTLVWLSYRATTAWKESADLLEERRAQEKLAVLAATLNRDMKGAHLSLLVPITHDDLELETPHDLADSFARAFARFPYPEFFFVWKSSRQGPGLSYFFHRADRPPEPYAADLEAGPFPVVAIPDPPAMREFVRTIRARAEETHGRFVVGEMSLSRVRYQVVAHVLYQGPGRGSLYGWVGYAVNLDRVPDYFRELVRQVSWIGEVRDEMSLAILDETGRTVALTRPPLVDGPVQERRFPLFFYDPALVESAPSKGGTTEASWTMRVSAAEDSTLNAATVTGERLLLLVSIAALAAIVGLVLTVRAVIVTAELIGMKSDFVSTVTHELKTPLSNIRLVGDTLAQGRYKSNDIVRDYARVLSDEANRLTLLIDNLLAYARISDVSQVYNFERLDPGTLVEDALGRYHARLTELGFDVNLDLPPDLPAIRADRPALLHVLDNLIDNAIKYSRDVRSVTLRGAFENASVVLQVIDRGIGILPEDIHRVFDKFFRGSGARAGGSGLGLAICRRIARDHGGDIEIRSSEGQGTTVAIRLPVAEPATWPPSSTREEDERDTPRDCARASSQNLQ